MGHEHNAHHELLHLLAAAVYLDDTRPQAYQKATAHFGAQEDWGIATISMKASKDYLDHLSAVMGIGPLVAHPDGRRLLLEPDQKAAVVLSDEDLALRLKWKGTTTELLRYFAITQRAVRLMPMQRLVSILCSFPLQNEAPLAELFPQSRLRTSRTAVDRDFTARRLNPKLEPRYV